MFVEHDMLLFL